MLRFIILFLAVSPIYAAETFDTRFHKANLRIDLHHAGDADSEFVALDRVYRQGEWAGSQSSLVDPYPYGRSVIRMLDPTNGAELASRGFDTIFGEYRTTGPAHGGVWRSYHESVLLPFPRQPVTIVYEVRDAAGKSTRLGEWAIDPESNDIAREQPAARALVLAPHVPAKPSACLDIAFIGEGYTQEETTKFRTDLERFSSLLLSQEPYASMKDRICVRGVMTPSFDSGCDEPRRGRWHNTAVGASFNALGSERYLLTEDNRALRDIAANIPYDTLIIMVNHERYGGGGIYNLFCTFTADNEWSDYLVLHEFGHSFAGLADEYYTSSVAYEDLHPATSEPSAPNVTALLDPSSLKWGDLVADATPLPTPWRKEEYDERDLRYQEKREALNLRIAEATRNGETKATLELETELAEMTRNHVTTMKAFLAGDPQAGRVGAFEGAGYASRGLYRPTLDCLMFTRGERRLCPVCRRATKQMISWYAGVIGD